MMPGEFERENNSGARANFAYCLQFRPMCQSWKRTIWPA